MAEAEISGIMKETGTRLLRVPIYFQVLIQNVQEKTGNSNLRYSGISTVALPGPWGPADHRGVTSCVFFHSRPSAHQAGFGSGVFHV